MTHSEPERNGHVAQCEPMKRGLLGKSFTVLTSEDPAGIVPLFPQGINEELGTNTP